MNVLVAVGASAAIVSAVAAVWTLALYLRSSRVRLEVWMSADAASGSIDGESAGVYTVQVINSGATPVDVRLRPMLDDAEGEEGESQAIAPTMQRTFTVSVLDSRAVMDVAAVIRYGRRGSIMVRPGERLHVG